MATVIKVVNNVITKQITNTTWSYAYNTYDIPLSQVSILLTSGSATLLGQASGFPTSDTISLPLNVPVNLSANNNLPIGNFTINAAAGTVLIVATATSRG